MQLLPCTLALFLVWVLNLSGATAIPAMVRRKPQTSPGIVTMPLRRFSVPRIDAHPQLLVQQNINRASKRLARMTGRAQPLEHELRAELTKRMYLLESGPGSRVEVSRSEVAQGSSFSRRRLNSGMAAALGRQKGKGVAAAGSGTPSGNTTAGGTAGNGTGVSPLDIQAANNGGLTAANNPTANNSLGLAIEADDVAYIATVQIGTPPQNFNILMDSGSADFWVGAENCQSQQGGCGNHTFLGTQSSSSFVQNNTQFQVTYGSGAVAGQLCQDNVVMAGLALQNHTFGVAAEESIQFASSTVPFDGLMGFAQSILSQQKVLTPVEALAANGLISSAITSFKISRLADQLNDGEITFGGLDSSKFDANTLVTFPNVNTQGFWEGAVDTITVNGADSGLTGRTAILDTGTTLILAPPSDAQTIIQGLGGACDSQQCTVPCTSNASLALSFGNSSFAIDPRDLAVLPVDPNNPTGDCSAGIQPQQIGAATEWLVGDVFLKNAYFSIDVNKNQISLAKLSTPA